MSVKGWKILWLVLPATLLLAAASFAQPAVWTEHNDNNRSGDNLNETILTPTNVDSTSTFGKLWSVTLDDQAYTSPLYIPGLTVNGGTHNVVFVETVNDSVYAFDADTGTQLWHVNLLISGDTVPSNAQASAWGACGGDYMDFTGKFGIVGTPVINTATNTMYLVARSYSGSTYVQQLHALNILTGADVDGGPVTISGSYDGSTFSPQLNNQRPSLTLVNGTVYIAWSSHCDYGAYNGFVMGYNATNLAQQYVWADTTNGGSQAGIWMGGQGLTVDASNDVYVMTGNGTWDGSSNFGESFVKLSSTLGVLDYFTPSTWSSLNGGDEDVGSAGSLQIPGTTYIFGGGKTGIVYLLNESSLGHEGSTDNVVQEFQATFPPAGDTGHIHGGPTYWNNGTDQYVYLWGENDYLRGFQWLGSSFNSTAVATSTMLSPMSSTGMPGGFLSISANGASNGILWALEPYNGNANQATVEGILHAFNANPNGSTLTELWNSKQNAGRDDFGNYAKDTYPVVSNGKVYVSTFGTASAGSGGLWCYGLLTSSAPSTPSGLTATASVGSVYLSWSAAAGANSYNVYRSTTSGGEGGTPIASGITVTSYSNTGLSNGTTYYYTVAAVNTAGTSGQSSQVYATPTATSPVQINMSSAYNVNGIYEDGSTFSSTGGFDAVGDAYSSNLLTNSVIWNGDLFVYGPANGPDCVSNASVTLPSGSYTTLTMLAAGIEGNQASQTFTVHYTDGSTSTFTQSVSDWFTPQSYSGESTAVTCAYRDEYTGVEDARTFYIYGYSFALNSAKTVSSITLPATRDVVALAMDLIPASASCSATPSAPTGLAASGTTTSSTSLSWSAVTPPANCSISSYTVYKNGSSIGTTGSTTFSATGLSASTTYTFSVAATDSDGTGSQSSNITVTTSSASCSAVPSAPTGLSTSGTTSTSTNVNWSAVTPPANCSISSYTVYKSGTSIGTTGATSFSVTGLTASTTYTFSVAASDSDGAGTQSSTITVTTLASNGTGGIKIACGNSAQGSFVADTDFSGGSASSGTTNSITTSKVANPAPTAVYQHGRKSTCTYTIPGLTAGASYTVRLDFCEYAATGTGQRTFDVSINGTQLLTNFDIYATAGGEYIANAQIFNATANSSGQIVIVFTTVVNNVLVAGVEVEPSGPVAAGSYTLTPGCAPGSALEDENSATTNGNPIVLYQQTGSTNEEWTLGAAANNGWNLATLGPYCLQASGTTSGSATELWACAGSATQDFVAGAANLGGWNFALYGYALCLDVNGASSANNTAIQVYTCNGTNAQNWALEPW